MKSAKILVSAVLIPALLVASDDSTQKLMRKPRYGRARITFADGTQATGVVSRVTTQFLSLQEADACRNVELGQIASIKWMPGERDSLGDILGLIAWVVIGSPLWVPWYIADALGDRNNPLSGNWESTLSAPGIIRRIESNKYGGGFVQRSIPVQRGRYELVGQDLHLIYDGSGLMETIPLGFDCDSLVLGDQRLSTQLSTDRAQAAIVGRWFPDMDRSSSWEFTVAGVFEKRVGGSQMQGRIQKIKDGVHVKWLGPDAKPDEDWGIQTKGHHLFITAGGVTTEYVHAAD